MLERSLKQSRTALVLLATSLAFTFAAPLSAQDSGQPIQRVSLPAAAAATAAAIQNPQATTPASPQQRAAGAPVNVPQVQLALGSGSQDGLKVTGAVGTVIVLGALTMLPAVLLLMTGFTRILIVLHLLRQAIGTQSAPPGQLLTALALILTGFVMAPTVARVNETALTPWLDGRIDELTMLQSAILPLRDFMIEQTPEQDVAQFVELSNNDAATMTEVPTTVLAAAFATSELRAAFKMGFAIFLPFVVIDLVVAAVLSGMGMFMLPPTMIALPCKLLLFVLVDGWTLTVQALVRSFGA
jgi:flagellar biosynthetic protein FliP